MKKIYIAAIMIALIGSVLIVMRFVANDKDAWICQNGTWVKRGNPSGDMQKTGCGRGTQAGLYDWSTSDHGPYQDKVSFAKSNDLLTWTDVGVMLADHASVPGAVVKDGTIFVYFVDVNKTGIPEQLGMMSSPNNGSSWEPKKIITIEGIGDKVPVDPAPILLPDGRIRLYYFDINEGRKSTEKSQQNKIYSAISNDGIAFVQEDGVRFAREGIFDPDVEKQGDLFRMYVGDLSGNKVISATSSDGLSFTEEGVVFDGGAVPDVIRKGETYYLFTAGIDISTSSDGKSFVRSGKFFRSKEGSITADPSVVQLSDDTYLMMYKYK